MLSRNEFPMKALATRLFMPLVVALLSLTASATSTITLAATVFTHAAQNYLTSVSGVLVDKDETVDDSWTKEKASWDNEENNVWD